MKENHIIIPIKTPYYTYGNKSNDLLKNIWLVCHGYGQLARHFIKRFDVLDPIDNYVIAVQGLSKFYVNATSGNVGATWMTKEDRLIDIENQLTYLDNVFDFETKSIDLSKVKINFLGFSQGVNTVCRWINYKEKYFDKLILWAGSFPDELEKKATFINSKSKIIAVVGLQDPYFNKESFDKQLRKVSAIFKKPEVRTFEGKHEVQRNILKEVIGL